METVTISKEEYQRMKIKIERLRKLEKIDFDLLRQFKENSHNGNFSFHME
ncbi:hypothetical protein J4205_02445 [Candidatus Pacearchaeota archaeon]|nr:hypothetical protein [Candidatus Pacearchaeota archaeon]